MKPRTGTPVFDEVTVLSGRSGLKAQSAEMPQAVMLPLARVKLANMLQELDVRLTPKPLPESFDAKVICEQSSRYGSAPVGDAAQVANASP